MQVARPKPSEDVEDLEQQQNRFLASNSKSAATVKRVNVDGSTQNVERKKSRFKEERQQLKSSQSQNEPETVNQPILVDLVERPGTAIYVPEPPQLETTTSSFPTPTKRDISLSGDKMSIFMKTLNAHSPMDVTPPPPSTKAEIDKVYAEIEQENAARLQKMSTEEILSAQAELLRRLDPKLIKFIKERKARPKGEVETIIKGGSQLDDSVIQDLLKPEPTPNLSPSTDEFRQEELPISPDDVKHIPHMSTIEKEKLTWMTMLPKPKASATNKNFTSRFDFEGRILPADCDIPTHKALHHHGDEPERAGYTTSELFAFLASSVQSQRILGLQVLSNILINHHAGKYDGCFPNGIIESLVDNGLVTLLRISLDDQSSSQLSETLKTLRNLLTSPHDEMCLDLIYNWVDEEPHVRPYIKILSKEEKHNTHELQDETLIGLDVVRGLLRMDVLPRIRYLLEVCQPDAGAVGCALEVLIRLARHSPESAQRIVDCPRLCAFIIKEYLPLHGWNTPHLVHGKLAESGGIPLALALKFIRVLCSSSKTLTAKLFVEHSLERAIGVYLAVDINDGVLPRRELMSLQMETLRLLRVLLKHGLCADLFDDISPLIVRQISFAKQIAARRTSQDSQLFDLDYASCLVQCVHARMRQIIHEDQADWTPIAVPIIDSIKTMAERWLHELTTDELGLTAMGSLSAVLRFLADLHFHKPEIDISSVVASATKLIRNESKLNSIIQSMVNTSVLLQPVELNGIRRDATALPSLASVQFGNETVISLGNEKCPVFLLDSLIYFLWSGAQSGIEECYNLGIQMLPSFYGYLGRINSSQLSHNWFARTELSLLYRAVRLAGVIFDSKKSSLNKDIFRETALSILPYLSPDRSASVSHLLSKVVFNENFYSELSTIGLSNLRLDKQEVRNASGEPLAIADEQSVIKAAFSDMNNLLQSAKDMMHFVRGTISPKYLDPHPLKSGQCEYLFEAGLLPKDWMYLPLRLLYAESLATTNSKEEKEKEANDIEDHVKWTLTTLRTVYLMSATSEVIGKLPPLVNYIRLASTFLIDCETFLNKEVSQLLCILFANLLSPNAQQLQFDSSIDWTGLPAFTDFYSSMLEQFDACSYGDSVFAAYLLCPQQPCYHADIRKVLYIEHSTLLRSITIGEDGLLGIAARNFLEPKETDKDILVSFRAALSSKTVTAERNPFMYKLLKHHTN